MFFCSPAVPRLRSLRRRIPRRILTWWNKYQTLLQLGAGGKAPAGASLAAGVNVDVSNECGPQSETRPISRRILGLSGVSHGPCLCQLRINSPTSSVDRFNHWLDRPVTGDVNVSFYDTRNDTTGSRYMTDVYLSQSTNGGASWSPNVRVTTVKSERARLYASFRARVSITATSRAITKGWSRMAAYRTRSGRTAGIN